MNKEIQYGYDKTKTSYVSDSTKGKTLCKQEFTTCEIVQENKQLKEQIQELKHIMYVIRDDNGFNHLWCKDMILDWLESDDKEKIIKEFVNSDTFEIIEDYISKPYIETINELENNWNTFKKWLNNVRSWNGNTFDYEDLMNKMQQIERR